MAHSYLEPASLKAKLVVPWLFYYTLIWYCRPNVTISWKASELLPVSNQTLHMPQLLKILDIAAFTVAWKFHIIFPSNTRSIFCQSHKFFWPVADCLSVPSLVYATRQSDKKMHSHLLTRMTSFCTARFLEFFNCFAIFYWVPKTP